MKAVVSGLGYRDYVMDVDEAVAVIKALSSAERFKTVYHAAEEATPEKPGRKSRSERHIWGGEAFDTVTMRILSDDEYRMAKLLGKPDDN